jgi:TPP-dependent pyruvate/acetoin dehydrogenase alpha subunit
MAIDYVAERAAAYGRPGVTVYGNDPLFVYDAVKKAAERARKGDGPTLIECLTYRRGGHKRDDPGTYRPKEEVEAWFQTDPIPVFRERLLDDSRFDEDRITALENDASLVLDDAVEFALASDDPPLQVALEDVYA